MARNSSEPKRLYYKIGEACKLLDIQPYVLRYWETEFPQLAPSKSRSGQRVYSEPELETIRRIKQLLYEEGFTIAGAKKKLEQELANGGSQLPASVAPAPVIESEALETSPPVSIAARHEMQLDTHALDRIETLREGVGQALDRAREILDLLRSRPT